MKIALVIDDTLDSTDGVQQVILEIGRELTVRGYEVHYLTSTTTRGDLGRVHSLARNLRFRFNGNRVGIPLPASRARLRELLAAERYDLVHVAIPYSPLLAGRIISLLPDSTTLVGTFMILPLGPISTWGGKLLGWWQRPQVPRFDHFMAVSEPASEFSRFMYGRPGIPTANPVRIAPFAGARARALAGRAAHTSRDNTSRDNTSLESPVPSADTSAAGPPPVRILFLGRLVERKGAGALLRAATHLREFTRAPFTIEIAGRGPLADEYAAFVGDHGLSDVVRMTGFIEEEAKADLLAGADIIALPALGGESFGISVVEAFAAGTGAVLAGDNLGYASTAGPLKDCLIDPRDPRAFARRLGELIDDPGARAEMSAAQSARAEEFDTPAVVSRIERVYASAASRRQALTRALKRGGRSPGRRG